MFCIAISSAFEAVLRKLNNAALKLHVISRNYYVSTRLTFLVCSLGFTSMMLFDDKKQPYPLMLYKFIKCGGQTALFE